MKIAVHKGTMKKQCNNKPLGLEVQSLEVMQNNIGCGTDQYVIFQDFLPNVQSALKLPFDFLDQSPQTFAAQPYFASLHPEKYFHKILPYPFYIFTTPL